MPVIGPGAGASPWTPADDIGRGLVVWLDAADTSTIVHSGGAVSQWLDKSQTGRHVSQGTTAAMPTTGIASRNGLNVLSFDGGDRLSRSASALDSDLTVISTFKVNSLTTYVMPGVVMTSGNQAAPTDRWHQSGTNNIYIASKPFTAGADLRGWTTWKAWSYTYSKTTSTSPRLVEYDNNVQKFSVTNDTRHVVTNQALSVGQRSDGGTVLNGEIAEIMIYNRILIDQERNQIQRYLGSKWGLVLSDGNVNSPPLVFR